MSDELIWCSNCEKYHEEQAHCLSEQMKAVFKNTNKAENMGYFYFSRWYVGTSGLFRIKTECK